MAIQYRPEIDGLRTVAVVSVLVYHLKIATGGSGAMLLGGGFLGVDIFFVISGFLITSILLREIDATGRFSVVGFYERRIRRILPALFVVLGLSFGAGLFILMPSDFIVLGNSMLASLFFVSNIFWMFELSAYGATAAQYQPLLHTWSLGVEEQFYIFYPLILLVVMKAWPKRLTLVLTIGAILGFAFCQLATGLMPKLSFYWLPSRVWELLAGCILASLAQTRPELLREGLLDRVMPYFGIALTSIPMIVLHLDQKWHPGLLTLPVILGTCALIWWNDRTHPVIRVLSSAPFVRIGLVSYSLYLWHYPVYAFGRMLSPDPGPIDYAIWMGISFAGAFLSYHFIEAPFRQKGRFELRRIATGFGGATVAVVLLVVALHMGRGYEQRFPRLLAVYGESEMDNGFAQERSWSILDTLAGDEAIGSWNAREASLHEKNDLWFSQDKNARKYLIVGNSHAKDTFNALHLNRESFSGSEFARYAISDLFRPADVAALRASPNYRAADEIVVSTRFETGSLAGLERFARVVRQDGKTLTLMGPAPEFEGQGNLPLFDWYIRESADDSALESLDRIAWKQKRGPGAALRRELAELAQATGAQMLWKEDFACEITKKECFLKTATGRKALFDYSHYTLDGARFFGQRMHGLGWFGAGTEVGGMARQMDQAESRQIAAGGD